MRKRYLTVSLRAIFLLLTIVCLWLGHTVNRARQQRKVVASVRAAGGSVRYDFERGKRSRNAKPPVPDWLVTLCGIDVFANVVELNCGQELDATEIRHLSALEHVRLWDKFAEIGPLSGLVRLQTVDLLNSPVSDLAPLEKLTRITSLELSGTNVSDLTPIANLRRLEALCARGTPTQNLAPLRELIHLRQIDLTGTKAVDLVPLGTLLELESLGLADTGVVNLTPLSVMSQLRFVNLRNTQVHDISPLMKLYRLEYVDLQLTNVSEADCQKLRQALPDCTIEWKPRIGERVAGSAINAAAG